MHLCYYNWFMQFVQYLYTYIWSIIVVTWTKSQYKSYSWKIWALLNPASQRIPIRRMLLLLWSHPHRNIGIVFYLLLAHKRTVYWTIATHRLELPLLPHQHLVQFSYLIIGLPETVSQLFVNLGSLLKMTLESFGLLSRFRVLTVSMWYLSVTILQSFISLQQMVELLQSLRIVQFGFITLFHEKIHLASHRLRLLLISPQLLT